MAAQWSDLPPDIILILAKILNTDVDRIRLRSICSSWRATLHPLLRPIPFPFRLPPFSPKSISSDGACLFLSYATVLFLSRPKHGRNAGDPSDGWLFRVLEVSPNFFSVLAPLFPQSSDYPSGTVPKGLNLLDYRISEVCKSYGLIYYDGKVAIPPWPIVRKVLVLRNYAIDCQFAVLALFIDWSMSYWKFRDDEWTSIPTKNHLITDVAVCNGICYAISRDGVLLFLNPNFKLKFVDFPHLPTRLGYDNRLVEYNSYLYAFTKIVAEDEIQETNRDEIPLRLEVFKKCDNWTPIKCLGDHTLLSSDDYSFGFSVSNFSGLKRNCVYMVHIDPTYSHCYGRKYLYGVYNLDKGGKTSILNYAQDQTVVYWPTPEWLMSGS